jgi:hypothetical protein
MWSRSINVWEKLWENFIQRSRRRPLWLVLPTSPLSLVQGEIEVCIVYSHVWKAEYCQERRLKILVRQKIIIFSFSITNLKKLNECESEERPAVENWARKENKSQKSCPSPPANVSWPAPPRSSSWWSVAKGTASAVPLLTSFRRTNKNEQEASNSAHYDRLIFSEYFFWK